MLICNVPRRADAPRNGPDALALIRPIPVQAPNELVMGCWIYLRNQGVCGRTRSRSGGGSRRRIPPLRARRPRSPRGSNPIRRPGRLCAGGGCARGAQEGPLIRGLSTRGDRPVRHMSRDQPGGPGPPSEKRGAVSAGADWAPAYRGRRRSRTGGGGRYRPNFRGAELTLAYSSSRTVLVSSAGAVATRTGPRKNDTATHAPHASNRRALGIASPFRVP